jgi:hypothetical protein
MRDSSTLVNKFLPYMGVLVGISEGKRPVGRPRHRRLRCVKKYLKGMGRNRAWHRSSDWQPNAGTAVNIWVS